MKKFNQFGVNINEWISNKQKYNVNRYGKLSFSYFVFKKTGKTPF